MRPLDAFDLESILDQTRPLWEEMRGQRLFLTGGTGFFGVWLLSSFLYANRRLGLNGRATVLSRDPGSFARRIPHLGLDPAITLMQGDIRAFQPPDGSFDHVIHAATDVVTIAPADNPLDRYRSIADGTARVLDFAATHGTRKFMLTSSGAVYGRQPEGMAHIPEDYRGAPDVLDPAATYGEGKRVSELMCALYAQQTQIDFSIARCFALSGPGLPLDSHFALGNFIRDAMNGGPIQIGGDGTPTRSYLYAVDLSVWLWTMLFRSPSMEAFNLGSEEGIAIRDLATLVAETLNPAVEIRVAKTPVPGAAPMQYVPSTQKARTMLSLRPTVSLRDAILRTAAWHGFTPL